MLHTQVSEVLKLAWLGAGDSAEDLFPAANCLVLSAVHFKWMSLPGIYIITLFLDHK